MAWLRFDLDAEEWQLVRAHATARHDSKTEPPASAEGNSIDVPAE